MNRRTAALLALGATLTLGATCQKRTWEMGVATGYDPQVSPQVYFNEVIAHGDRLLGLHTTIDQLEADLMALSVLPIDPPLRPVVVTAFQEPLTAEALGAYLVKAGTLAEQWHPPFWCVGNEVDQLDLGDQIRHVLAVLNPHTTSCVVLQYERMKQQGLKGAVPAEAEAVAFTTYPSAFGYLTADSVPVYDTSVAGGRPVLFTEIGWHGPDQKRYFERLPSLLPSSTRLAMLFSMYDRADAEAPFNQMGIIGRPADAVWKAAVALPFQP